jgi:hypothetical protein
MGEHGDVGADAVRGDLVGRVRPAAGGRNGENEQERKTRDT